MAAEQRCGLTCGDPVSCAYRQANYGTDNVKCCTNNDCNTGEICVTQADGYYSQCVNCSTDNFKNDCGYWGTEFKEAAVDACTEITACEPSLQYYVDTDPEHYKCASNGDCSGSKVCLEGNGQSVCFDCSNVDSTCFQYWDDQAILDGIKAKCNKSCKFNDSCNNNPSSTDKCNNHHQKCKSRVQQDSETGFWHQCEPVDSNQKPCKVNGDLGVCNPNVNSMWAP